MLSNYISNLITQLKETLESDEKVKQTMQNKISELKSRIDGYKDDILNKKGPGGESDLDPLQDLDHMGLIVKEDIDKNGKADEEDRRGFEYMLASTALANEHQSRIFLQKSRTCMGRFRHRWHNFWYFFLPFKSDMNLISYRYDRDVLFTFEIIRLLFMISFSVLFTYLYFLITHALNADYNDPTQLYCKYMIPCVLFYSRVTPSEGSTFSITYAVMTFVVVYFSVMKYIQYSKLHMNSQLYDREETKFSQYFFTSWDWSVKTNALYRENKRRLRELYKLSMQEVELIEKINSRNSSDKLALFFIRLLSCFLGLIILVLYAVFIFSAYIIRNVLKSQDINKTTYTAVDIIYEIIPPILIVIFGIFFQWLFTKLVHIEKWDFQSTVTNQITIRYFIARVWSLGIIYFINVYFNILGKNFASLLPSKMSSVNISASTFGCPGTYTLNLSNYNDQTNPSYVNYTPIDKSLYAECPEDDSVINILFIYLAEFIITKIIDLFSFWFLYCCSSKRKIGESYKWPFRTGKISVDNFMWNIQLYAIITYFPYIVVLIPIFLWIEFKYEIFKLKTMRAKPNKFNLKQENGLLIMILFNMSILIIIVFNTIFFISSTPHSNYIECINNKGVGNQLFVGNKICGPFASNTAVSDIFANSINSTKVFDFFYYIISNPEPLIIILILVICFLLYKSDDVETYKFYVKERERVKNLI